MGGITVKKNKFVRTLGRVLMKRKPSNVVDLKHMLYFVTIMFFNVIIICLSFSVAVIWGFLTVWHRYIILTLNVTCLFFYQRLFQ